MFGQRVLAPVESRSPYRRSRPALPTRGEGHVTRFSQILHGLGLLGLCDDVQLSPRNPAAIVQVSIHAQSASVAALPEMSSVAQTICPEHRSDVALIVPAFCQTRSSPAAARRVGLAE